MAEQVKLVIWDLDETFWSGTLSDGPVAVDESRVKLVNELVDRGIMNSICSKNDFASVKEELTKLGVWDLFIFPSVDWTSKGARIAEIIGDCQLRAPNVLFLDDNVSNLEEAKFLTPLLQVATPDFIGDMLNLDAFRGKDDRERSRLQQYKTLEMKKVARGQSESNDAFLQQSEIVCEVITDCLPELERLHEMIHRNNQLNFTKNRITVDELRDLLIDPEVRAGYVKVRDKYGDHGVVGFFAVKNNEVKQLVFSCRILGMGIEQYIYASLGYPALEVVGEVSTELNDRDFPNWIHRADELPETGAKAFAIVPPQPTDVSASGLLLYGTCDQRPLASFLENSVENIKCIFFDTEPSAGNLRTMFDFPQETLNWVTESVPMFSADTFSPNILSGDYRYILLSVQWESGMRRFVSKRDSRVTVYVHEKSLRDGRFSISDYNKLFDGWDDCGYVDEDTIRANFQYLCDHLPVGVSLILLTVGDIVFAHRGKDEDYLQRMRVNSIAERLAEDNPNVRLLDIRKFVKSELDVANSVNHYNRDVAFRLSTELRDILAGVEKTARAERRYVSAKKNLRNEAGLHNVEYQMCVENNRLLVDIDDAGHGYLYSVVCACNYKEFFRTEFSTQTRFAFDLSVFGHYWVAIEYRQTGSPSGVRFSTPPIEFSSFTAPGFLSSRDEAGNEAARKLAFLGNAQSVRDRLTDRRVDEIAALGASAIGTHLKKKGLGEVFLYAERRLAASLVPGLLEGGLALRGTFCADYAFEVGAGRFGHRVAFSIPRLRQLQRGDCLIVCTSDEGWELLRLNALLRSQCKARIVYLVDVLQEMGTQAFFVDRVREVQRVNCDLPVIVCSVPTSQTTGRSTSNVRLAQEYTRGSLLSEVRRGAVLPDHLGETDQTLLKETLSLPEVKRSGHVARFGDWKSRVLNVKEGQRRTVGQSGFGCPTIWIFGSEVAFGAGVSDAGTIASWLQVYVGSDYRVVNYANCVGDFYGPAVDLMETVQFGAKDLAIFVISTYRREVRNVFPWYDAITDLQKVDTKQALAESSVDDLFITRNLYNATGNRIIAETLFSEIRKLDSGGISLDN